MAARAPGAMVQGRRNGMSDFREQWNDTTVATEGYGCMLVGNSAPTDWFIPDRPMEDGANVMATCLREAATAGSSLQKGALALSALCCVLPNMRRICVDTLKSMGAAIVEQRLPSSAAENAIVMVDGPDTRKCLLWFSQLVLILFKNVNDNGYNSFITKRIKAARAVIGMPIATFDNEAEAHGDLVFSRDEAANYKSILGAQRALKIEILKNLMSLTQRPDIVGQICHYLCNLLAWTDMSGITFIFDVLLATKSPVLSEPRVAGEILNLLQACQKITASTYPQYFRILNAPSQTKFLERGRFPLLLAVASEYRKKHYPTAAQFVVPTTVHPGTVAELLQLHEFHMRRTEVFSTQHAIRFLTQIEQQDEGHDNNDNETT